MNHLKILLTFLIIILLWSPLSSQTGTADKIEDYFSTLEESGYSGYVYVSYEGDNVASRSMGYSDRGKAIKNTARTAFDIGSITKQFTGAAILKLEMQGKLTVEDHITKYFTRADKYYKDVTIHHLLTHSAGLPEAIGNDYDAITNTTFLTKVFAKPPKTPPGTHHSYSNVGYSLLALIIEQVSGQPYEQYLHDHLFAPVDMLHTGYEIPDWDRLEVAIGYLGDKPQGKPHELNWSSDGPYLHLKGNGGIMSTTEDMLKWHRALLTDDILSEAAKKKYYHPHISEGHPSSNYGYGWVIMPTPRGTNLITHNGGNGIFFADFWRYLEEGITILIWSNNYAHEAEIAAMNIAGLILNPDYEPSNMEDMSEGGEDEIDGFALKTFDIIKNGSKEDWQSLIRKGTTKEFRDIVAEETHLEYLKKFRNEIGEGQVVGIDINRGGEVTLHIENASEKVVLLIGFERAHDGQLIVSGLMMDED